MMLHRLVAGQDNQESRFQPSEVTDQLIVAHVDHGLREDSVTDARFVRALAEKYNLEFEQTQLQLNSDSEASARTGRWEFLRLVKHNYSADFIATAHHQGDVIETMIINLLRGTNRKGLTSLSETNDILRPLLNMTKQEIYEYALEHQLEWVQDESNSDDKYLRNRIRKYLVPRLSEAQYSNFLEIYNKLTRVNAELDSALDVASQKLVQTTDNASLRIESKHFSQLPEQLQRELFANWWYQLTNSPPPDSLQLKRMVKAVAVDKTGNMYQLANGMRLTVYREHFELHRI